MPDPQTVPPVVGPPDAGLSGQGALGGDRAAGATPSAQRATLFAERPEIILAAALVGGFLLATIIKRLAR